MRIKKYSRAVMSVIAAVLIITQTVSVFALTSKGACAMDVYTGDVLFEYNADEALAPASMTKVMTTYILYDKMNQGAFDKDTEITCSENAARLSRDSVATNVPLVAGEKYTVDELIGAIMIPSACAACTLVGEYISGSEEKFAKLMNQYVYQLGLEAYYDDASGLSDNNRITARSMAKLGARFIRDYPDILNYTSLPSFTFRGRTYSNTNYLLPGNDYTYEGADGLKTGTTTLAGRCLTATAERDGKRIVGVTMRSTSTKARYTDIIAILDAGFSATEAIVQEKVYADTIKMYIDNLEIPSFYYECENPGTLVFAEHLDGYGFDIRYDAAEHTVYVTRDKQKPAAPVDSTAYDDFLAVPREGSNLRVVLNDDGYVYEFTAVYDLSGYAAISVDELENIYRYIWNTETMSGSFKV